MSDRNASADDESSIQIDYRSGRSVSMFLLQKLLRPIRAQLLKFGEEVEDESPDIKIPHLSKKACIIQERNVAGIHVYDYTRRHERQHNPTIEKTTRKRILYFAGGGWQLPASSQHSFLCSGLTERMPNTTISLISYPLAPRYAAPKSFPKMCEVYSIMLKDAAEAHETVIIAGDSAGGNIALCLVLHMLHTQPEGPAPAAIMALSPSTDLRRQNPIMPAVAKHDPLLTIPFIKGTAEKWRGEWDAFDARVSPLAADLHVLADRGVRVHGITGTYDILALDAILFRTKLAEAGVQGRWLEWDRQMHVWVLTARYGLREAKEGLDWIAEVLNET